MRATFGSRSILLWTGPVLLALGFALSGRGAGELDELSRLALALAIIVALAKLGGEAASRIGQPAVLGELLAGVGLGNLPGLASLRALGSDLYVDVLSRLGMLLLLFEVGLELSVRDLFAVGGSALFVAACGTICSFALGWGAAAWFLSSGPAAVPLFLGAAITATSVGITARVLKDIGASRSLEAKIILGAAVVDDVLALVVLALVTGWLGTTGIGGAFPATSVVALVTKTVGFLTLAIVLGVRLTPAWFRQAARLRTPGALLAVGLCFCFVLAWVAGAIGLAPLVGAFAAGLILEDVHSEGFVQRGERSLGELLEPITSFLVPVFFVLVGFRTNLLVLANPALFGLPLALTAAAVIGKLSCALGVVTGGVRKLTVAVAMIPRGEVTLIFVALGSALQLDGGPLLDERTYGSVVAVVILTTVLTPPVLKWSARSARPAPARDRG